MAQLRLYKVMEGEKPHYFFYRKLARDFRDGQIEAGKSAVVMRGPDHGRGESYNRTLDPTPSTQKVTW